MKDKGKRIKEKAERKKQKGETEILLSGFGGQGLMSLGRILARAALYSHLHTTWFPSYGAEMRGGTAHCFVKISDSTISSPLVDSPDTAIILNQPSLDKFRSKIKKGAILILNSDLISNEDCRPGVTRVSLPFNRIALGCGGNIKAANTVALGVFAALSPNILKREVIIKVLTETFARKDALRQSLEAFYRGEKLAGAGRCGNKKRC